MLVLNLAGVVGQSALANKTNNYKSQLVITNSLTLNSSLGHVVKFWNSGFGELFEAFEPFQFHRAVTQGSNKGEPSNIMMGSSIEHYGYGCSQVRLEVVIW